MTELPGPTLVSVEQIDALPSGSIVEVDGGPHAVFQKGNNTWFGTNKDFVYRGSGFPIGRTYLVRVGPLK